MPATLLCVCVHRFSVLHNVQHPVCDTRGQLPTPSDGGTREKLQAAWPPSPRAVCVYSVHAKAAISLINCSTNLPTERHTENAKKAIGGNSAQTETGRKKQCGAETFGPEYRKPEHSLVPTLPGSRIRGTGDGGKICVSPPPVCTLKMVQTFPIRWTEQGVGCSFGASGG